MKSLYGRQFLLTAGMILISFALLGTAFIGLSYQYTIRETRDSMERNADYVSEQWSLKTVWGVGYKFEVVNG